MFRQSIRLLARLVARHTVYYLISFGSLTLGISAFFLLSLYVYFEYSFDIFHDHAESVYRVYSTSARSPVPMAAALKPVAGINSTCRFIMTTSGTSLIVRDKNGDLFDENVYYADSTFFDFFSFPFSGPAPRRPLTAPDETIITKRLAEKYFPGEDAVGKTIEYTNTNLTTHVFRITGVIDNLPANTQFNFDVLLPFVRYGSHQSQLWSNNIIYTYVKLEPNANVDHVLDETRKIFREQTHLTEGQPDNIRLSGLSSLHFVNDARFDFGPHNKKENIAILVSVAILVLLIATINFVNLTTANATSRMKEVGLRKAIGASFRSLFRQFTGEAIAIAYGSFLIAIPLTWMLTPAFEWISGVPFQTAFNIVPDFVPGLMILFPLVIGLVAGSYPAFVIASLRPVSSLKGLPPAAGFSLRTPLVVVQFGITSFLLISTGVIIHQLDYMQDKDLGFDQDQVVILNVGGPGIGNRIDVFRSELLKSPDVVSVSASLTLPGDLTYTMPYSISETLHEDHESFPGFYVDPQFVSNMGIDVLSGRTFSENIVTDTLNFMLNESAVKEMVARYGQEWSNPVGKQLHYFRSSDTGWRPAKSGVVIGVVRDFNFASLHHTIQPVILQVDYKLLYKVLVKIRPANAEATLAFLRDTWNDQDLGRPFNFQFLDERFAMAYEKEKSFGDLFTCLAVLSIMISCFGLYGLVLHTTVRRSKEISIRKVLGASTSSVVVLLGKGFLKPVAIAFAVISPLAYYIMKLWLTQFAYQQSISPALFVECALVCILIAGLTILSRTMKVSRANPVQFLR